MCRSLLGVALLAEGVVQAGQGKTIYLLHKMQARQEAEEVERC